MPIVIWAGQGRDSPLIYFQQKQKYKKAQWQRLFKAQEVTTSGTERMTGGQNEKESPILSHKNLLAAGGSNNTFVSYSSSFWNFLYKILLFLDILKLMKKNITKPALFFLIVLILDASYSLFNFIRNFENEWDNLAVFIFLILHLIPLIVLIIVSQKIPKIEDKKKLSLIEKYLILYLSLDVFLGLVTYNFSLPRYIKFLFYSKRWLYDIVYMIRYQMYYLAADLILNILYWISFAFLLKDISNRWNLVPETEKEIPEIEKKNKISPSFKISIANMIVLAFQTVLNFFIYHGYEDIKGGTGEHALGMVFVAFFLIIAKFIFSLPTLVLSIIGIVKGNQQKNKDMKLNQKGLTINIVCLVICELQVWLWW